MFTNAGVGHVGSLIREYAGLWGFRVVCCDPPREEREHCGFLPLEEVAREADLLTFHTPLDTTTRHMAGEELFARLKPGAVVMNSSRGEVVDGDALLRTAGLTVTLRRALRLLERGKALSNVRFSDAQSSFYAWSSAFVIAFKNAKLSLELHGFLRLLPF